MSTLAINAVLILLMVAIHLFANHVLRISFIPRSPFLSIAGGVSMAYVFIHILPELQRHQQTLAGTVPPMLGFIEHHVYLVALLGLVAFYTLDKLAIKSRARNTHSRRRDETSPAVFWLHMAFFSFYNGLIGYLIQTFGESLMSQILFAVALGLHFLVNDYSLHYHHKSLYERVGRWILGAAVVAGWIVGIFITVSDPAIAVIFAFLSGSVIMNTIKEELPDERESRLWAFLGGTIGYAALLLAI